MKWDWTEQWLQDAAGWKVVKEAKRHLAAEKVTILEVSDDEIIGTVMTGKLHKTRISRQSKAVAEIICTCVENRRNGTFCEHAAALVLAHAQKKSISAPVRSPIAESPRKQESNQSPPITHQAMEKIPVFRIQLPPQWVELVKKGRCTVKLEIHDDESHSEENKRLLSWLRDQGVKDFTKPQLLSLSGKTIVSFFRAIWQHPRVVSQGVAIKYSHLPAVRLNLTNKNNNIKLSLKENTSWHALNGASIFLRGDEIAFVTDHEICEILITLFAGKYFEITLNQLFTANNIRDFISEFSDQSFLDLWRQETITARVDAVVFGTIERPQIRINGKISDQLAPAHGAIIRCTDSLVEVCDRSHYDKCLIWLKKRNWQRVGESDTWKVPDENTAINFWESDLPTFQNLVDLFEFAPCLALSAKQLNRVEAHFVTSEFENGSVALRLGFRTASGKDLHADKITQLLRSGKRLIQTNDGSSLLLPKESWEAFLATVQQSNWIENRGSYIVQRGQKRLLREMRKNISSDIDKENFTSLIQAKNSIAKLAQVTLRNYQEEGIHWLHDRLEDEGFCLLADEMGLGKTLQSIALLASFATPNEPALIVLPTSLLGNWSLEIEKFLPSIQTIVHHGDRRDESQWTGKSVIVTSYKVLSLDRALFLKQTFSIVILDEASLIRNPDTDSARTCFRLMAKKRLALTGTPVENHLRDLWSIFQFLQPGYLGERKSFEQRFCSSSITPADRKALSWRTKPYILRRTKSQVAKDLPEKIEIDEWCELSTEQQQWYREFADEGLVLVERCDTDAQARMQMLTLILRLRQTCCDLALLDKNNAENYSLEQRSGKMIRLVEIVQECLENDSKVLVFSQFAKQLHLIRQVLLEIGIGSLLLDGATTNRSELVADFQRTDGPSVFLISLKAGGYGLNLTAADTVILFEPWWNPAVERQAMDRAHRIGQIKTVNVYRLLTRGTMEQRVKNFQNSKNQLMEAVMDDPSAAVIQAVSQEEIRQIFSEHEFS